MTSLYLAYGAAFLCVAIVTNLLFDLLVAPALERRRRKERLDLSGRGRRTAHLVRQVEDTGSSEVLRAVQRLLAGAGSAARPSRFLLGQAAWAACLFALLRVEPSMGAAGDLAFLFAGGVALPPLLLAARRAARLRAFSQQLPEALDAMVRSLRAGHPVSMAIQAVAEQMPAPLGQEFETVEDQMSLGADLPVALRSLAERVPDQDLRFMVVAVSIQHSSGGNLAEVLSNLARVIRSRAAMVRKKNAITAEGRLSFWVITLMPFLFMGVMALFMPGYFGDVWGHPYLDMALAVAGMMQAACAVVVWKMVSFKV